MKGGKPLKNKGVAPIWTIVTTKEISEILGFDSRRIQQLADIGAVVRVAHGKYDLPASVQAYVEYKAGRVKQQSEGEIDNSVETALWTRARKEKVQLEVQIIKGELHRSEDVERVMNTMLGGFRARLLSLPTKIAPKLLGKTDINVVKELLKEAVHEAMNELSNYDPHVFFGISKDKMFLEDEENVDMEERRNSSRESTKE